MKHNLFFSAICGLLFGICAFVVLKIFKLGSGKYALICGMLFFILLLGYLMLAQNAAYKRYKKAETKIDSPVWMTVNGNINTGVSIRNANIYFCEKGLVFISLDRKPYFIEEVLREAIVKYDSDNLLRLLITVSDGRVYDIISDEIGGIKDKLIEKGWLA